MADLNRLSGNPPAQRQIIADLLGAARCAADPREAVLRRMQRVGHVLKVGDRALDLRAVARTYLVGMGKAATPMADAVIDRLGGEITAGVLVTRRGLAVGFAPPARLQVIESGHPVPDEHSVDGARAIERMLQDAADHDLLICAISGGSSALVTLPVTGVSLNDVQATTELLLRSGATIREVNAVRKHLDRIKGGGLARMARGAQTIGLVLSDVIGDDLSVIASGPTSPDPSTFADAWRVIERFKLTTHIPPSVRATLEAGLRGDIADTPKPGDRLFESVYHLIVGSNRIAAEAAEQLARRLGFNTLLLSTLVQGEAREVALVAAAIAREIDAGGRPVARPACVIWGGETTVTVRGGGRGGRNQELALSAALGIDGLRDAWIVALATDGIDGPTDAAGAMVSGETIRRARQKRLNPEAALDDNDSYGFFSALSDGSHLISGPTGTNVNDLLFVILF